MRIFFEKTVYDQRKKAVATFEVEGEMVDFTAEQMPGGFAESLIPNAIVECEIVNGCIVAPVILYDETKQKEDEMRNRLHGLFKRKKQ